jgi:DNA-binding transcriptional ArsR family regulator
MTSLDLERIASTVGDPSRVRMLVLLMEGRALTAKEMALGAGITPATTTAHLHRLAADALIVATPQGRHKYFRLASEHVANLLEALMRVAPRRTTASGRQTAPDAIRQARYCYDHLAGHLGISLLGMMRQKKWLVADKVSGLANALEVSRKGERALTSLGLDLAEARGRRRLFACTCLDWSERRDHLGGALGAALAARLAELEWIMRKKHSRVVAITPEGREQLRQMSVSLPD